MYALCLSSLCLFVCEQVNVFPRTKYDEFLLLGTNGFWEAVEEYEVRMLKCVGSSFV